MLACRLSVVFSPVCWVLKHPGPDPLKKEDLLGSPCVVANGTVLCPVKLTITADQWMLPRKTHQVCPLKCWSQASNSRSTMKSAFSCHGLHAYTQAQIAQINTNQPRKGNTCRNFPVRAQSRDKNHKNTPTVSVGQRRLEKYSPLNIQYTPQHTHWRPASHSNLRNRFYNRLRRTGCTDPYSSLHTGRVPQQCAL